MSYTNYSQNKALARAAGHGGDRPAQPALSAWKIGPIWWAIAGFSGNISGKVNFFKTAPAPALLIN